MKTELLQQLSREITQGEWIYCKPPYDHSMAHVRDPDRRVIAHVNGTSRNQVPNARALSLTPQLIKEVLELRALLHQVDSVTNGYELTAARMNIRCLLEKVE